MLFSSRTNFDGKHSVWSGGVGDFPMNCRFGFGHLMLNELYKAPVDYVIQNIGIECEDNITIISAHHDDLVSVLIGASATGTIINPLDPSFSINEIVHFMRMAPPKLVICDQNSMDKVQQSIQMIGLESKILIFGESKDFESIDSLLIGFESTTFVPADIADLNKAALVMCSSGTTGLPKGVILSHLMATNGLLMWWSIKTDEVYFSPSNLYWLTSIGMIFQSVMHHCPRIIVESNTPVTANVLLDVLIRHKVNVTFVSPAIAMEMLSLLRQSGDSLESMRVLACGGSFLSDQLVQSISPFIPNGKIFSCYGMTELSGLVSTCEIFYKKDTVGQLGPNVEVSIVDDDGHRLQPEECGEICIRHKLFEIKGYLNDESANQNALDTDNWYHWLTGDIGFFDCDGFLHLIDRKKEMLKYCNYQISPTELELCIQKHFAVDGVCVIGIDEEKCGQLPAAVIVRNKNGASVTEEAVIRLVADYFSDSKRLRGGVFFVNALPMTSSGKIQRKLVKQMVGSKN